MTKITLKTGVVTAPYQFRSLRLARSFADNSQARMRVVMGDAGVFWVVAPADAARLERAGYETA
jgi:hypothetical protein